MSMPMLTLTASLLAHGDGVSPQGVAALVAPAPVNGAGCNPDAASCPELACRPDECCQPQNAENTSLP